MLPVSYFRSMITFPSDKVLATIWQRETSSTFTLDRFGLIKINSGVIALLVRMVWTKQTVAVQLKYARSSGQRHANIQVLTLNLTLSSFWISFVFVVHILLTHKFLKVESIFHSHCVPFRVMEALEPIPAAIRWGEGIPWTGSQFISMPTHRQTTMHAHTYSKGNSSLTCMFSDCGSKLKQTHTYTGTANKLLTEKLSI